MSDLAEVIVAETKGAITASTDPRVAARWAARAVLSTLAAHTREEVKQCSIRPAEDCGRCRRLLSRADELYRLASDVAAEPLGVSSHGQ
jgi:hypothetical protein